MLAGNAGHVAGDCLQRLHCGQASVDINAVALAAGYQPSDQQPLLGIDSLRLHRVRRRTAGLNMEQRLQFRPVRTCPYQACGGSTAQQEIDGIDNNGFAGSGFAAKDGQPFGQTDAQIIDDCKIFNG